MAFDPTKAGPVHVDPQMTDGGVIVDMTSLSSREMTVAMASSRKPYQVYKNLGFPPKKVKGERQEKKRETGNDLIPPGSYVTPPATAGGSQKRKRSVSAKSRGNHVRPVPPPDYVESVEGSLSQVASPQQPQVAYPPAAYPQSWPAYPAAPYYPPQAVPPVTDPNLVRTLDAIVGRLSALSEKVDAVERPTQRKRKIVAVSSKPIGRAPIAVTQPDDEDEDDGIDEVPVHKTKKKKRRPIEDEDKPSLHALDKPKRRQHLDDLEERPRDGIIKGFETLRIPFVTGPVPQKAKKQVFFEFGEFGRQAAKFHDVIVTDHNVVLVWDTRYEDGNQYAPPALGPQKPFTVHVTPPKGKSEAYTVAHVGTVVTLGVFEQVVLFKTTSEDEGPPPAGIERD